MIRTLLISLATACVGFSSVTSVFAQGATATGNRPGLTVLDTGTAPRRELRYQFDSESAESAAMDMNINMSMSMGGIQIPQMNMPTIRMVVSLGEVEMSADGTARYEFEIGSMELIDTASSDPALANAVRASLGQVPGISGWARVNSRGATLGGGVNLGDGIDPQLSQVFDSAEQSLQQMSAPLPEEPVGVGAQWRVVQDLQSGGFDVSQTATYTIVAMQGQNVTLDVAMTQTAPAQVVEMPGMPPGAGANLESLESSGTGSMQIDLTRFMPTSNVNLSMAIALAISAGGGNQRIDMNLQTDMSISPFN